MDSLFVIDGNSMMNRAFYALPLLDVDGVYTNAIYGFCNMLIKLIDDYKPKYIAVMFDFGKKTFRNNLYNEYKATRKGAPEELRSQFPLLQNLLKKMGFYFTSKEGFEADDLIGSLVQMEGLEKYIVSGDRDLLQLINPSVRVLLTKKGLTEIDEVNLSNIQEKFGFLPHQVADYKGLLGDFSDNIPGILGVGEKTAETLLRQFGSIEEMYSQLDKDGEINGISPKLREKLLAGREMAFLSKQLAVIDTQVETEKNIASFTYTFPFSEEIKKEFERYAFHSLLRRKEIFEFGQNHMQLSFF